MVKFLFLSPSLATLVTKGLGEDIFSWQPVANGFFLANVICPEGLEHPLLVTNFKE